MEICLLSKMHHISKNWECVFDFQYKVVIGQCNYIDFDWAEGFGIKAG